VGAPQASVAVAEPNAASIAAEDGLQPSGELLPVAVIAGGVASTVHVAVLDVVAVFPQASVAVNVLVWERLHPLVEMEPSTKVIVGVLQPSVAVAEPRAPLIAAEDGLQPAFKLLPLAVMVGGVLSVTLNV